MDDHDFIPLSMQAYEVDDRETFGMEFGLAELDRILGPLQPGLMHIITGYAHSGKTQLAMTMVGNNPDKGVVLFTPDETVALVLQKIVQLVTGMPMDRVPCMGAGKMRRVIEREVPNLAICDRPSTIPQMGLYLDGYAEHYGEFPSLVIYDYLELLPDTAEVRNQANLLKSAAKATEIPWMVIHQSSRSGGANGKPLTLSSMSYGGEREAHTVIGVWRRHGDPELDPVERAEERLAPSVNVSVLKNKQRPEVTDAYGVRYVIDTETGMIRERKASDRRVVTNISQIENVLAGRNDESVPWTDEHIPGL